MQTVAQGWLALQLTNSAFQVGLVTAAQQFPVLVLSLYGGVIADRHDKLRLAKAGQWLFVAQASLLWWFSWSGHMTIGWLLALAVFNGLIASIEIPARQSFIVELVGREDLVDAIALNSAGFNLARIVGPSIAALVIGTLGLQWCFGLNALSYVAVLGGLYMIKLPAWKAAEGGASPLEGMLEGFRYVRQTPLVYALIRVVAVYSIFALAYIAMMPVVAQDVLHTDAAGYGLLLTFVGVGALLGALSLGVLGKYVKRGPLFIYSSYAFAVLLIAFSFVHVRWLASVVLFALGFTMLLNGSLANGLLQSIVPDELRGRVVSAYVFVSVGLAPIGSFIAGAVAERAGVDWAVGGGAVIVLVYSVWAFRRYPAIRAV